MNDILRTVFLKVGNSTLIRTKQAEGPPTDLWLADIEKI